MKRRVTTDTHPADGHLCIDAWGRDGLTRRWLLPAGVQRDGVRADAGVRLIERPDGTILCALVIGGDPCRA